MKFALLQINPTVGALEDNRNLIVSKSIEAFKQGADVICTPELCLSGYPPEDLINKDHFCEECDKHLDKLKNQLPKDCLVIVGSPTIRQNKKYNSLVIFNNGKIIDEYHKQILPNYSVFDEKRLFKEGDKSLIISYKNKNIGFHICEDSWDINHKSSEDLINKIDYLINISASPYHKEKSEERKKILSSAAKKINTILIYCNLIGGQDELVFDGGSLVISNNGKILSSADYFKEQIFEWHIDKNINAKQSSLEEEIYEALKLGLKDYVNKTGFKNVIVGLSGGIDSALVLAIAVDVLGNKNVEAVTMPSQFSSNETLNDAIKMAKNLNIKLHTLPIENLFNEFNFSLSKIWGNEKEPNLTEENLQARIRGSLIMALSNEYNKLVLTTGNKSEIAMGYCTLYGDMCGGFSLLKDVPKTLVFSLCKWRNSIDQIIPPTIITRPPSAELKPNQKDSDSLPSYDILDPILELYIEKNMSLKNIINRGYDKNIVKFVINNVEKNEYKRRQTPPGVKITPLSFDRDRRMPIANKYLN